MHRAVLPALYSLSVVGHQNKMGVFALASAGDECRSTQGITSPTAFYIIGTTGSLVPAVPTEQADTFWGYSSVPIAGVAWWRALPTYKGQELEPFRISPEEAERDRLYEERKRASVEQSIRLRAEWRSQAMYVVEATDTEHQFLWERYHHMVKWEQLNPGEIATIGHLKKRPISVDIRWARLDGQIVMFYYPCSTMIDWTWIKNWLRQEYPNCQSCNAANFHNCLGEIRRSKAGTKTDDPRSAGD